MNRLSSLLAVLILIPISQGTWAAEKIRREDLGRSVKLTILVDKVFQPEEKWVTKEWMVQATAEAGFNVLSPRAGFDRMDEVRQVTAWCAKYGIYYMPWMRGSLAVSKGEKADGKRIVWANGAEQEVWSPNADEFWDWTNRYILEYARISAENEHLMGVFLDYENYAKGKQGNLHPLSYDDIILRKFAEAQNIQIPTLEPAKRKTWLDEQGLHEKFSAFQIDYWRAKCRALRKAIDAINPKFQFCIYPAPGTLFMVQATYPEWSTAQAPLILADASTYGRPGRLITEQDALVKNQQKLERNREIPKQAGIPFIYTGGIDPVVRGARPGILGQERRGDLREDRRLLDLLRRPALPPTRSCRLLEMVHLGEPGDRQRGFCRTAPGSRDARELEPHPSRNCRPEQGRCPAVARKAGLFCPKFAYVVKTCCSWAARPARRSNWA